MPDRSALALQLTDAITAARAAVHHAGDRAFRTYGLSHRAHAVLTAVDVGGPDGARPKEIAAQLGVSRAAATTFIQRLRSEEHTSELQSRLHLVCRLLLEKKKKKH